jgi:YHS domain-containing protein
MSSVCQHTCGAHVPYEEADIAAQPGAKPGDLTRCVVSGAVFQVTEANPKTSNAGASYYFCCEGCAGKFHEEPSRFLGS